MTTMAVAADNNTTYSEDTRDLTYFCDKMREQGYDVTQVGVGPNKIQNYMLSHSADIMIQIGGGLCCGTLGDFINGIGKYYHAKKGSIIYNMKANNLNPETHPCRRAQDWYYDMSFINKHKEMKYPDIYQKYSDKVYGFAWGKNIEETTANFIKAINGQATTSTDAQAAGGSGNVLDLIKQAMNPWDQLGVQMTLHGDTVTIKRTDPDTAVPLSRKKIQNNTITFEEYDPTTPNKVDEEVFDQRLIDKYGVVDCTLEKNDWKEQALLIGKRGHGHSIDLKALMSPYWQVGNWVKLDLPELEVNQQEYYISKLSLDSAPFVSLTLEPAPPSLYVEEQKAAATGATTTATGEAKTGRICSIISKVGGVPITDPKSLYENFKKFHYRLYYSEEVSIEGELRRIQNGESCNCTDFAQLYYEAYKEAGWDMNKIRYCNGYVQCSKSYGHVWLNVDLGNGWEICDPSGAAKGKPWGSFICGRQSGTPSYNQSWLLSDDGVT